MNKSLIGVLVGALVAATLAACGGSGSGGGASSAATASAATSIAGSIKVPDSAKGQTINVVYQEIPPSTVQSDALGTVAKQYAQLTGGKMNLRPINATADDYFAKVALMQKSAGTAPDIVSEDSFQLNADVEAGYLVPLDEYLSTWPDWKTAFPESSYAQGMAQNGKVYGIPDSTDTRGLWYSKDVFAKAGLPTDWHPKSWQDVLDAANQIKAKKAAAVPFFTSMTKAQNEQTTMQNFEMLLSGTPGGLDGTLYDSTTKKWQVGSKGFGDALKFEQAIHDNGVGLSQADMQNPNIGALIYQEYFPQGKIGIGLDGSWKFANWLPKAQGGTAPWDKWSTVMGWTAMPTQDGQAPGTTSMSGGFDWSMGAKASHHDAAWVAMQLIASKDIEIKLNIGEGNIPVRSDIATDPEYTNSNPSAEFFASLVKVTHYRPSLSTYPEVSIKIQECVESVTTGKTTPDKAQKTYDAALKQIVGDGNWTQSQS